MAIISKKASLINSRKNKASQKAREIFKINDLSVERADLKSSGIKLGDKIKTPKGNQFQKVKGGYADLSSPQTFDFPHSFKEMTDN